MLPVEIMSLSPQHYRFSRMWSLGLDACFTRTYTHTYVDEIFVGEKIKVILINFLVILEQDSWRVGKNLRQIYDESALTYDIYNELRGLNIEIIIRMHERGKYPM